MTMAMTFRTSAIAMTLCAAMAVFATLAPAKAQSVQRIAAIVNDELITAYDLESRIRLVLFSTRLPDNVDTRRRIRNQVLRTLIDERLQFQEAKRRNISVSNRDIERAKLTIEKQNNMPKGGLERILKENRVGGTYYRSGQKRRAFFRHRPAVLSERDGRRRRRPRVDTRGRTGQNAARYCPRDGRRRNVESDQDRNRIQDTEAGGHSEDRPKRCETGNARPPADIPAPSRRTSGSLH